MLSSLQNNIGRLIAAYEGQRQRADLLEKELEDCRRKLDKAKVKINRLEENISILQQRTVFLPPTPENYTSAKAQVDALIKEIDDALALLS